MFSRPNGDVEKLLSRLPKMPTTAIIQRMREVSDIQEKMFDVSEKERFSNLIVDATYFIKKALPHIKGMKKSFNNFRVVKAS